MKTISLKLPEPLANWLANRSKELGRSQSDIVRQALEEKKQGQRTGVATCGELLADFDGFFEGPAELSTNPKYMKDYGK
ncbi:MAG: ribbon-helix-helix protein, CopG family [Verrucomicrobiales bacterium]